MLCGQHPFKANNNMEFCEQVLNNQVHFNQKEWRKISIQAKTMIKGMLVKNPKKRLSIIELLVNKWMKKYCNLKTKPKEISIDALK